MSTRSLPAGVPPTPPTGRTMAHANTLIVILCGAALSYALSNSLLTPLVPRIESTLLVSPGSAVWIVTSAALAAGVSTPMLARWGDTAGRKRVLVLALTALTVGSLVCALATSYWLLLAGRVLQGCAGAGLPMYLRITRDEMPEIRRNFGLSVIQACNWLGAGIGALVAGYLAIHTTGFRSVFWINFGVSLIALIAALLKVPRSTDGYAAKLDIRGTLLLGTATASGLIALSEGNSWGWTSAAILVLLAVTILAAVAFVVVERTCTSPIIHLNVLAIPAAWGPIATSGLAAIGYFGTGIGVATYVQQPPEAGGLSRNALQAAYLLIPLDCMIFLAAPLVAYLATRAIRPGYSMVAGPLFMAAGTGGLLSQHTDMTMIAIVMGVIGFGFGLTFSALTIEGTNGVPHKHVGSVIGVAIVVANVLVTLAGAVLSASISTHNLNLHGVVLPTRSAFTEFWLFCLASSVIASAVAALYVRVSNRRMSTQSELPRLS
ncbi:MFS transporter [Streptomyces chartreusis]|uniref:MFS transporter n=1 Tax=Streptomyces chartreusis TaxID=1969 RepID=UPI0038082070